MTPENLLHRPRTTLKCTFGCPIIDACLAGGVPSDSITELVAESGCGKTQLCLQLALYAQLPTSHGGLSASSLYLHTEFPFPFRRLQQLSHSFSSTHHRLFASNDYNPCDQVYVHSVHSADQLLDIMPKIESFLTNLNNQLPIRLIVVDSIAALFRSEFENTSSDLKRRSSIFFKISAQFKSWARRFGLAVLVTNQVVDLIEPEGTNGLKIGNLGFLYTSGRRVVPALGLAWANCVNSRLFLARTEEIVGEENGLSCGRTRRQLHVVFAPHLPYSCCDFVITREKVIGVDR